MLYLFFLYLNYYRSRPYGKGVAQVVWIRNLGTTCCSQFDSNTLSEAQASEVSTVRFSCRARIFEILKSRKIERVGTSRSIARLTVRLGDM